MAGLGQLTRLVRSSLARWQRVGIGAYSTLAARAFVRPVDGAPDVLTYLSANRLMQPDETTCGSASLLVAEMIADPAVGSKIITGRAEPPAGETVQDRFGESALTVHDVTNSLVGPDDKLQIPWPKSLGTQPWSAVRYLNRLRFGIEWIVVFVDPVVPGTVFDRVVSAVDLGYPCLLFIGNAASPRHIVLAVRVDNPTSLTLYEPSSGGLVALSRDQFASNKMGVAGWDQAWLAVTPA